MADQADRESKTEEASPRQLEQAIEKGNVPFSREVANVATLVIIGLALPALVAHMAGQSVPQLAAFLERPVEFELGNAQDVMALAWFVGALFIGMLWPVLLLLMVLGVLSSSLQNTPRFVMSHVAPDLSRISIAKGLNRIIGIRGQMEFLKSLVKIAIVSSAFFITAKSASPRILNVLQMGNDDLIRMLVSEAAFVFLSDGIAAGGAGRG